MLARLLTQLAKDALNVGVLNGSGASGQPTGIFHMNGPVNVSGTSMNFAGLAQMEESCVLADDDDVRRSWFSAANLRRLLRSRELTARAEPIWPGKTLLGSPTYVSGKMPASSLLDGDFSNIDILLFGNGVGVLVNPYADLQSDASSFKSAWQWMSSCTIRPASPSPRPSHKRNHDDETNSRHSHRRPAVFRAWPT